MKIRSVELTELWVQWISSAKPSRIRPSMVLEYPYTENGTNSANLTLRVLRGSSQLTSSDKVPGQVRNYQVLENRLACR